jgi:hypothetical protein
MRRSYIRQPDIITTLKRSGTAILFWGRLYVCASIERRNQSRYVERIESRCGQTISIGFFDPLAIVVGASRFDGVALKIRKFVGEPSLDDAVRDVFVSNSSPEVCVERGVCLQEVRWGTEK